MRASFIPFTERIMSNDRFTVKLSPIVHSFIGQKASITPIDVEFLIIVHLFRKSAPEIAPSAPANLD